MNPSTTCLASTFNVDEKSIAPKAMPVSVLAMAGQKLQDTGNISREDFDDPVSLDEIINGLFLGNLTAATHMETLKNFNITHILTLDSVPLPKHITEASFLTTKFIQIADMPKEDVLHHLDSCVEFISSARITGHNILVHCYFGVSRSSTAVIAYIMKSHNLDYQTAFELVKSKRRFVQPNVGFAAQLKLWRRMGCTIDNHYQKYKIYRLRLAGEQVRKAKILPQSFSNIIKSDPAITQENPEPIVYRCRKCRRVLASKSHVLTHMPKIQISSSTNGTNNVTDNQKQSAKLMEQIPTQARKVSLTATSTSNSNGQLSVMASPERIDVNKSIEHCQNILFVEPIAWMRHIVTSTQGKLNCPKCEQKLGNFSWINGRMPVSMWRRSLTSFLLNTLQSRTFKGCSKCANYSIDTCIIYIYIYYKGIHTYIHAYIHL
ncbi:dual specificity protein phosphatase MPK-4 isoform 1-T1 [Glossina fuscipes fuscipes]